MTATETDVADFAPLEDRLRRDLPALARALAPGGPIDRPVGSDTPGLDDASPSIEGWEVVAGRSGLVRSLATAAAVVAALVAGAMLIEAIDGGGIVATAVPEDEGVNRGTAPAPSSTGTTASVDGPDTGEAVTGPGGTPIASPNGTGGSAGSVDRPSSGPGWTQVDDAPIEFRYRPVSVWTGEQALFWAGSSETGGRAFTDGAGFDPVTWSWERLDGPGWGHPGLQAAYLDGWLYTAAKGNVARLQIDTGVEEQLPQPGEMMVFDWVTAGGDVYAVGSSSWSSADVVVRRYDPASRSWSVGDTYPTGATALAWFDATFISSAVSLAATVDEIVVWSPDNRGYRYDLDSGTWSDLPPASDDPSPTVQSRVVATDGGIALVVVRPGDEVADVATLTDDDGRWYWSFLEQPVPVDPESWSAVAVGEAIMVLSPGHHPQLIDPWNGGTTDQVDGPVLSSATNTVWTGSELVVWTTTGTWIWRPT